MVTYNNMLKGQAVKKQCKITQQIKFYSSACLSVI